MINGTKTTPKVIDLIYL